MSPERLELVAARHVFGCASNEEVVGVADDLLCAGIYTYGLGELGTLRSPTTEEVTRWLRLTLREMNVALPSLEEAILIVVKDHMWVLAEERRPPLEGLAQFWEECHRDLTRDRREDLMRVNADCREVLDLYSASEYYLAVRDEDLLSEEDREGTRKELEASLVERAREWLREHCRLRVDASWLRWNGGTVRILAEAVANEQAFHRLPLLADALEDAGCANAELLGHCRGPGPHARGCWVVDLLLGGR